MSLLNKFKKSIRQHNLIDSRDSIVIGVSGGADSICLLYLLRALKKELGLTLHIAHLNHMLRAKESKADADFVLRLSQKLNIPATLKEVDAAGLNKNGSQEEIARKVRFDFLFEVARKNKAKKIALGHTLDDQAETVLMRIIRGSGLLGLSGILPKRKMGDFVVIRPLLGIPRKEIDSFLRIKNIKPRIDSTNLKEIYFRNRIRHRLLPEMKKYNPNIKEVLAAMAENIAADYDYVLKNSLKEFDKLRVGNAKPGIKFALGKFLILHPSLQNSILRLAFEKLSGDTRRLTYQHIRELKDLIYSRPRGSIVDLPSQISVIKNPQALEVYVRANKQV